MNDTGKGNLLEVTKSRNLVFRPYFPLILCFFDWFFFEFWNARFWGNYVERNPMFGFVVGPEVLCKETFCDLSNLVKVYMGKYPINPLRGVGSWLICCVLGCVPSIFVVETIEAGAAEAGAAEVGAAEDVGEEGGWVGSRDMC
jgi:hypothetical protein